MQPSTKALWITIAGAVAVLTLLCAVAANQHVPEWDGEIVEAINDAPRWTAYALWPVMQLGSLLGTLAVGLAATYFWGRRRAAAVLLSALLAWSITAFLKEVIERGRPFDYVTGIDVRGPAPRDFGFPSGHTTVAFAIATALVPVLSRRGRVAAYAVATVVALARMVYGVHFPLDTLGGMCVGVASGCVVELVLRATTARAAEPRPS